MCGISGIVSNKDVSKIEYFKRFNLILKHRGPDDEGIWISKNRNVGLCHTRLAIQDLSQNGRQPMISNSKNFIITFNGEIYNHLSLRNLLPSKKWISQSDTETLLEMIDYYGVEKTLVQLKGMFAFCVYDVKKQELHLCRDRFGEKPLYFGFHDNNFIFTSELKVLSFLKDSKNINTTALNNFFNYLYVPSTQSIFKNFFKLNSGCYLKTSITELKDKKTTIKKYYDKKKIISEIKLNSKDNFEEHLEKKLTNSLEAMLISDKPLGAFLSGGIDSSLICCLLAKKLNKKLKTFTIGFENKKFDESIYAKNIASYLNTDHHEHIFNDKDLHEILPQIPLIYDEPFSDSSQVPTYLISKIAKEKVSVALTGDGGDELFGGYNRYILTKKYWPLLRSIPGPLREIFGKILALPGMQNFLPKLNKVGKKLQNIKDIEDLYFNLTTELNLTNGVLLNEFHEDIKKKNFSEISLNKFNDIEKMMFYDVENYLTDDILCKVDRASMASSLETRAPFLDYEVFEYALRIPFNQKIYKNDSKYILKKILNKYIPKNLYERPKTGFGIPLKEFLLKDMREWSKSILFDRFYFDPFLDQKKIEGLWHQTDNNKIDFTSTLWSIISFRIWFKGN